jgi:hypothetical protein
MQFHAAARLTVAFGAIYATLPTSKSDSLCNYYILKTNEKSRHRKSPYLVVNRSTNECMPLKNAESRIAAYEGGEIQKLNPAYEGANHIIETQHKNTRVRWVTYAIFDDYFIKGPPDPRSVSKGTKYPLHPSLRGGDHYACYPVDESRSWFIIFKNDLREIWQADALKEPMIIKKIPMPEEWRDMDCVFLFGNDREKRNIGVLHRGKVKKYNVSKWWWRGTNEEQVLYLKYDKPLPENIMKFATKTS